LELYFGGAKPTNALSGDGSVWQNVSLLSNAIDSEKYLGCMICQACKVCQTFYLWAQQGPKWHNAFRYCLFCFMRQNLFWIILPSF